MKKTQLELYLEDLDGHDETPILDQPPRLVASIRCWIHQSLGIVARHLLELSKAVSQELLYQVMSNREIAPALAQSSAFYKDLVRDFHSGGGIRMELWWFLMPSIAVPLTIRVHGFFYKQESVSWHLRGFIFQVVFSTAVAIVLLLCLVRRLSSQCSSLEREVITKLQSLKGRIAEILKFIAQLQTIGLGHGLHRPRSPLFAAVGLSRSTDEVDEAMNGGDLSCRAMRRRLFAVLDCLHTSLRAQLESFSAEDEDTDFKIHPYRPYGLGCPDLSSSPTMAALSVEALEQLVTALLVAATRPQIRSLRLLLPSSPPPSSSQGSFASSIALLSTAASTVIHLLQHVSFLHRLSRELSRNHRLVADIAPALMLPSSDSYPFHTTFPESLDDSKKSASAYIQARGALVALRRKVDLASQRLWLCERVLSGGDVAVGGGFAMPAARAIEALSGCQLHLDNEDDDDDIELFASSLLPGKLDLVQLLSLLQRLRVDRHDDGPHEQQGAALSTAAELIEQPAPSVPARVRSSQSEYPTEFTVMESAPADRSAGSIAGPPQDEEVDGNKVVDVYTAYIPSRRPAAKRVRAGEGGSDSNRDAGSDRTLTLLHELRRHLRGRSVRTVERVKSLLDESNDDIDDDTPIIVKVQRAGPVDDDDYDVGGDDVGGDHGSDRPGYVDNQPNAAHLLAQQKPDALEHHSQSNFSAPLLSELFLKVRSTQNIQPAAVFGSDSDNDADG